MTHSDQFIQARSIEERAEALTAINRAKQLHDVARHPQFLSILNELKVILADSEHPKRLFALVLLCKVATLVKSLRPTISGMLNDALRESLGSLQQLSDPDDRYYAATFWRYSQPPWSAVFLAQNSAFEETAESVRKELCEGLLASTNSYAEALSLLSNTLLSVRFETDEPGNSMGRRLKRTVSALRHAIAATGVGESGEQFGSVLRELIRKAFRLSGRPTKRIVEREAAVELLELLSTVTRVRIASAFEPDAYSALFSLHDWFSEHSWQDFTSSDIAKRICADIADAVEVTVRSGRPDRQLLETLLLASGSKEHLNQYVDRIVGRNLGLAPELVAWLQGRKAQEHTQLSQENQVARMETTIAGLMLESSRSLNLAQDIEDDLLPSLETFSALPSAPLRRLATAVRELNRLTADLARERLLEPFGTVGEVVDFSTLEHELIDHGAIGSRRVRLLSCGVLSRAANGPSRVVLRAKVEPVDEGKR